MGALAAFAVDKVTVAELLKQPDKFNGKAVEVTAAFQGFQQKTSRAGNKYFTFKLKDGDKLVNVFCRGTLEPPPKEGSKLKVVGLFRKEKLVGDMVFKNEIDATKQDGKEYGVFEVK